MCPRKSTLLQKHVGNINNTEVAAIVNRLSKYHLSQKWGPKIVWNTKWKNKINKLTNVIKTIHLYFYVLKYRKDVRFLSYSLKQICLKNTIEGLQLGLISFNRLRLQQNVVIKISFKWLD